MTKTSLRHLFLLGTILTSCGLLPSGSIAATSTSPSDSDAAPSSITVPVQTPKVKKPTAPTVAAVPQTPPPAPAAPPVNSLTVGDLTISHMRAVYKKDHLDIFLSIKNASKSDEKLGGADSSLGDGGVVQVIKDKDGKEQEAPVSEILTADKTIDFSPDTLWLRIKDVKAEPKATDVIPVTLYFRRSPNAMLKIAFKGGDSGSSSLLDWLKK